MGVDVTSEVLIDRDREEVAAFAGDPSNAPAWYANIASAAWETEPPIRVGSRLAFVARFLGRQLSYTYEVVDHVPGVRLVMRTSSGPFPMETTYRWESIDGRTRMTLRNRGEPRGFSKLVAPIMPIAMKRATDADLRRLKALLEARPR